MKASQTKTATFKSVKHDPVVLSLFLLSLFFVSLPLVLVFPILFSKPSSLSLKLSLSPAFTFFSSLTVSLSLPCSLSASSTLSLYHSKLSFPFTLEFLSSSLSRSGPPLNSVSLSHSSSPSGSLPYFLFSLTLFLLISHVTFSPHHPSPPLTFSSRFPLLLPLIFCETRAFPSSLILHCLSLSPCRTSLGLLLRCSLLHSLSFFLFSLSLSLFLTLEFQLPHSILLSFSLVSPSGSLSDSRTHPLFLFESPFQSRLSHSSQTLSSQSLPPLFSSSHPCCSASTIACYNLPFFLPPTVDAKKGW